MMELHTEYLFWEDYPFSCDWKQLYHPHFGGDEIGEDAATPIRTAGLQTSKETRVQSSA